MGMCKECGKVFNVLDMKDGVCKKCRGEDAKQSESSNGVHYESTGVVFEGTNRSNEVSIVDVKIPFWSIVVLMVKWVLASIPAFIILFLIFFAFFSVAYSAFMPKPQNIYQNSSSY